MRYFLVFSNYPICGSCCWHF